MRIRSSIRIRYPYLLDQITASGRLQSVSVIDQMRNVEFLAQFRYGNDAEKEPDHVRDTPPTCNYFKKQD